MKQLLYETLFMLDYMSLKELKTVYLALFHSRHYKRPTDLQVLQIENNLWLAQQRKIKGRYGFYERKDKMIAAAEWQQWRQHQREVQRLILEKYFPFDEENQQNK